MSKYLRFNLLAVAATAAVSALPAKVSAIGLSQTEPVTLPDACKGKLSAPAFACLQPDRRVQIEAVGSR